MKRSEELQMQIEELENELEDLCTMSEEDACFRHNTDSKEEAIEILTKYLEDLYHEYDMPEFEEEVEVDDGVDPAFDSLEEFYRMRV